MRKKLIIFCSLILILPALRLEAQQADAGPDGVWVLMDMEAGTRATWVIYRKAGSGDWEKAGKLLPPKSEAEMDARLFDIEALNLDMPARPGAKQVARLWRLIQKNAIADSFASIRRNYPALYAAGFAWYDGDVKKDINYTYKVVRTDGKGRDGESKTLDPVKVPGDGPEVNFVLKSMKNTKGANTLDYEVDNVRDMVQVHIFRSYYQRTGYERINPDVFFTKTKEGYRMTITDATAADRVPYSYYIVPFDAAGNPGPKSIDVKMYSVPENTIPPSVTGFKSYSVNDKKAIRLRWKITDVSQVVSIDIYKSMTYDGKYFKIASMKPHDTQYFDFQVKPVATYYYTAVLNGMYENSPTSPRISGMLEGVNGNFLAPQQLQVEMQGANPRLNWTRTETDTRGYFLWRGIGSPKELKKVKEILSDSLHNFYTDTVPEVDEDVRVFYALTDVNTSYNEGPLSEVVSCVIQGEKSLLPPDTVGVYSMGNKKVRIIWKAIGLKMGRVQGYNLYRYYADENGAEMEGSMKKLNPVILDYTINHFIDSTMEDGKRCVYFVRSVGDVETELSKKSPEVVYVVPTAEKYANVSQVQLFPMAGGAKITWNNPVGDKLTAVEIWKAEAGKEPKLLKTLDAKTEIYTDNGLKEGVTYFYYLRCVYGNKNSAFTDGTGVTVK